MRSRAPLLLMEQMVMLAVFALAAALCLQAFVKSDGLSRESEARDRAAVVCQSAAEVIRHGGGDLARAAETLGGQYGQGLLWLDYDEDWAPDPEGVYRLTAQGMPGEMPGLCLARVAVEGEDGEVLFSINIAWQGEAAA